MGISINLTDVDLICPKCSKGRMLPVEDTSTSGAVFLKGWVCSNDSCGNNVLHKAGTLVRTKVKDEQER